MPKWEGVDLGFFKSNSSICNSILFWHVFTTQEQWRHKEQNHLGNNTQITLQSPFKCVIVRSWNNLNFETESFKTLWSKSRLNVSDSEAGKLLGRMLLCVLSGDAGQAAVLAKALIMLMNLAQFPWSASRRVKAYLLRPQAKLYTGDKVSPSVRPAAPYLIYLGCVLSISI